MATWKGTPYVYNLEIVADHGYLDYGPVEYRWEYQTTADSLVIISEEKGKEPSRDYYGRERAIAHMETMLDWFATYEGVENLEAIVAAIKEKKK